MSNASPLVSSMHNGDVTYKIVTPAPPTHPGRSSSSIKDYVPPARANAPEAKPAPPKIGATLAPPGGRPTSPPSSFRTRDKFMPWKSSSRMALDEDDAFAVPPTEEELRETFEEEEIQRFLNVFHTNIDEVTLPSAMTGAHLPTGEVTGHGQKIVIVAPEDVGQVTAAGAAPASAAVEAIPPSLAAQLGLDKKTPEELKREENDDDSSTVASEGGDSDPDETEVDEEVWVERHDGKIAGVGVPGEKDKKELALGAGALSSGPGHVLAPEDQLPSHQRPKKRVIKRERVWGSELAADFIAQFLPQGRAIEARNRRGGKHEKFSLTRLRTAGQRTYLSTYPFWVPLMLGLWDTARWIDWDHSFKLCCIWWGLWWLNMLLPAFLWYLVYQLIKHRILPYPTLKQLEERRQHAMEAEHIVQTIIPGGNNDDAPKWKSAIGMTSLGLGMGLGANTLVATNTPGAPVKQKVKDGLRIAAGAMTGHWGSKGKEAVDEETKMDYVDDDEELVDKTRRQQANDWRRLGLIGLEEVADLHERMRNLMLWRKPEVTRTYTTVIAVLAFTLMATPVQYLAKGTYAGIGFAYWFLIPTLCAMTRKQRALLPAPLFDVPTDAEYAMEIIARRLKLGHSVTPDKKTNINKEYIRGSMSNVDVNNLSPTRSRGETASVLSGAGGAELGSPIGGGAMMSSPTSMSGEAPSIMSGVTNVKANGHNVDGVTATDVGISANGGQAPISRPDATDVSPAMPGAMPGGTMVAPGSSLLIQTQTFSAHYHHLPGILTITDVHIEYTPLSFFNKLRKHSDDPKVSINLDCIRGVKKASSRTKSLLIRYIEPVAVGTVGGKNASGANARKESVDGYHTVDDPEGDRDAIVMTEREVKFKWVGHRDEVFARLVASKQSSWVPV